MYFSGFFQTAYRFRRIVKLSHTRFKGMTKEFMNANQQVSSVITELMVKFFVFLDYNLIFKNWDSLT